MDAPAYNLVLEYILVFKSKNYVLFIKISESP